MTIQINSAENTIELFHGTTPTIANDLFNCKVDVTVGGGEFGRGFYLGSSKRLAKRRAYHKTFDTLGNAGQALAQKGNNFKVLLDVKLLRQAFKPMDLDREKARSLYKQLKAKSSTGSYSVAPGHDYIVGPVAGRKGRYLCVIQYKFDSPKTECMLNKQVGPTIVTAVI